MSDESEKPDDIADVTVDAKLEEEKEVKVKSPYRIEIQNGNVFAGTLDLFEDQFFLFPPGITDEDKLKHIEMWAYDQGWTFQSNLLH